MIANSRSPRLLNKFSLQELQEYIVNGMENLHTDIKV